jgi:hypothetical protein
MSDKKFSVTAIINTISFFASCIKCGEKWDDVCQKALDDATDEIRAIRATPSDPRESLDKQVERLVEAINWACGCGDEDFAPTAADEASGDPPRFWWRRHLAERAGLYWWNEKAKYVPASPKEAAVPAKYADLGWVGIAGAIIDTVDMTDRDYVNEKLVEQLKRFFSGPKEAAGANTDCDEGCGLCGGTGIFEEGRCPQILGLSIGEAAGVSEENNLLALGMKRALNACENCEGDLDFAIFVIKRDIEALSTPPSGEQGAPECRICSHDAGREVLHHSSQCPTGGPETKPEAETPKE